MFNIDDFNVSTLTAAIEGLPHIPQRLGDLGLFQAEGIMTTTVQIEKVDRALSLIATSPRGSTPEVTSRELATLTPINTVHLAQRRTVLADEVQNARAFGSEDSTKTVERVISNYQAAQKRNLDATHEHMRVSALKGILVDANGSTVLNNFFTTFGLTQSTKNIDITGTGTEMLSECMEIQDLIDTKLGGKAFSGVRVICGQTFFRNLVTNDDVKDSYREYMQAAFLREDNRGGFNYGDITWEQYRGSVNGTKFIADDKAYVIPEGVSDMFLTRFAPADYNETVNTMGLPYYSKMWELEGDKGYRLEMQSNPIFINTMPEAVIELTDTSS